MAPGFVTTDMTDALPENMRAELKKVIPVRRFGEPTDIADTVAFLASPLSGYITAQVLSVDGGLVI